VESEEMAIPLVVKFGPIAAGTWNGIGDLMSDFSDAAALISASASGAALPRPSAALIPSPSGFFVGGLEGGCPRDKNPRGGGAF
jgi:hypothetical protein